MEEKKEVIGLKRWEFYTIIAILVFVMGVAGWATYEYVWGPQEVEVEDITPEPTAEDTSLTEIKTELEKDVDLDLSEVDKDIKELDSTDLSGL